MLRWDAAMGRLFQGRRSLVALLLAAVTLMLILPGFASLPPVDRDEASFAQSSRQMYLSRDYVDIRLHDAPRYKKPVGIYWLQAAAVAVTGGAGDSSIVTYRAVSLIAAVLSVLLTSAIGAQLADRPTGAVAGLLLAMTLLLGAEARLAKTDAVLLLTVLAAMLPLSRIWVAPERPLGRPGVICFWGAMGISVLVKGPIGPMVVGLAILGLALARRRAGWLRALCPLPGLAIVAVIVLPWYLAITWRACGDFWAAALGRDLIGKVAEGQESHGAPPGSYLALFWLTFWPACLPFALAMPAIWAARRSPAMVFCLAWALPTWIVFEIVATKLVHYVLPVYPALAIAGAIGWQAAADPLRGWWRKAATGLLLAVPFVLLISTGLASVHFGGAAPVFVIAALALSAAAAWLVWRSLADGAHCVALAGLAGMAFSLSAGVYPTLARTAAIWPSQAMLAARMAFTDCDAPLVVSAGYREPSVIFALGRDVRFMTGPEAAAAMADAPCALGYVSDSERSSFDARASELAVTPREVGRIDGLNIGSGKPVHLAIFGRSLR